MNQEQVKTDVTKLIPAIVAGSVNTATLTTRAQLLPMIEGAAGVQNTINFTAVLTIDDEWGNFAPVPMGLDKNGLDVLCFELQGILKPHIDTLMAALKTELDAYAPVIPTRYIVPVWDAAFVAVPLVQGESRTVDVSDNVYGDIDAYLMTPEVEGLSIDNSGSISGAPKYMGTTAVVISAIRKVKPLIPATPGNPEVPMVPELVVDSAPISFVVSQDADLMDIEGPTLLSNPAALSLERGVEIVPIDFSGKFDAATSYRFDGLPTGMSFGEDTGILSGTPEVVEVGMYTVIGITDEGETPTAPIGIEVFELVVPVFSGPIPTINGTNGVALTPVDTSVYFTGADTYGMTAVAGLAIDPATGIISGTPTAVATTAVTVTATNAAGATPSDPFDIIVA